MNTNDFYNWLVYVNHMQINTARARVSNCLRVCRYEGDLDLHYTFDHCHNLLNRLEYTASDLERNMPPRHSIPIQGNIYNGTATLKAAVQLYIRYRRERDFHVMNRNNQDVIWNPHNQNRINLNNPNRNVRGNGLQNRDFARSVAQLLTNHTDIFTEEDICNLTDLDYCRNSFNCHFPILVEVPDGLRDYNVITHVWGHRRFYDNFIIDREGHKYLISNDWYHQNAQSNRTLFARWINNKMGI